MLFSFNTMELGSVPIFFPPLESHSMGAGGTRHAWIQVADTHIHSHNTHMHRLQTGSGSMSIFNKGHLVQA